MNKSQYDDPQFPGLSPEEIKLVLAVREKNARKAEAAKKRRQAKAAVPAGARGQITVRGVRRKEIDMNKLSLAIWMIAKDQVAAENAASKRKDEGPDSTPVDKTSTSSAK